MVLLLFVHVSSWRCRFNSPWLSHCVVAVDKAYKLLLEPEQKKRALDVINAGKEYVEHMVSAQPP